MNFQTFLTLAAQSVTAPRDVARLLLSLRLNTEALLTAGALVVVLNALFFSASMVIAPSASVPGVLANPVVFLIAQAAALMASVAAFTWCGRAMGGGASMADIAVLLIWLQALRALVQAASLLLVPIMPGLGGLMLFVASALGVWILLNFIAESEGFDTLFKAMMVLILGVMGIALALTFLVTLSGAPLNGTMNNV